MVLMLKDRIIKLLVVEELMLKEVGLGQELMDIQKDVEQLQFLIAMLKENIQ